MRFLNLSLFTVCLFVLFTCWWGVPGKQAVVPRVLTSENPGNIEGKYFSDIVNVLDQKQVNMIFVGNSMLGHGVDIPYFNRIFSVKTTSVWLGGGASAWWYLVIKNVIPSLKTKPSFVGVFFRDNYLTLPEYRVTGSKRKKYIDGLSSYDETLLDKLAYNRNLTKVEYFLKMYLPVYCNSGTIKDAFIGGMYSLLEKIFSHTILLDVQASFKQVFDNTNMVDNLVHKRQLVDEANWEKKKEIKKFKPENSFLGAMIDICKENNIKLFFVRVKRLSDVDGISQSRELISYVDDLRTYLAQKNIPLLDYSFEKRIRKEHFGLGDHLSKEKGRGVFTELLAEDLKGMENNNTKYFD